jgi:Fur family transcriptional regulator, ferric uptake regulator
MYVSSHLNSQLANTQASFCDFHFRRSLIRDDGPQHTAAMRESSTEHEGSSHLPVSAALAAPASDLTARALARFKDVLRAKGARFSAVRNAIARAAIDYHGHFEAQDLVRALRARRIKGAHLATVYRTLPLLVEAGLIQQTMVSFADRAVYEASFERRRHDHLVCTSCGVIVEFELEAIAALQEQLARGYGFALTGRIHELLGQCASCRSDVSQRA